jgi:hypothetical protein
MQESEPRCRLTIDVRKARRCSPKRARELYEFIGASEHIADGGVPSAGAYGEAFPGSCRSTGVATTPQSAKHDSYAPLNSREPTVSARMSAPAEGAEADSAGLLISA